MRLTCPQARRDSLPISPVKLNLNFRAEIIPIFRALQQGYQDDATRRELLNLVGKDINQRTNRRLGRHGLNYGEVTVLAAARWGCNFDSDKLQDLAENHRCLRAIRGLGDWQVADADFAWQAAQVEALAVHHPHAAGIDIGSRSHWVCVGFTTEAPSC